MNNPSRRLLLVVAVSLLSACGQDGPSEPAGMVAGAVDPTVKSVCTRLTEADERGNASLRGAMKSTPEGLAYGGELIDTLLTNHGYHYAGAEMLGETCWVYANAKGTVDGSEVNLNWRCPLKAYRLSRTAPQHSILELVEDRQCDFGAMLGSPARRTVDVEVFAPL